MKNLMYYEYLFMWLKYTIVVCIQILNFERVEPFLRRKRQENKMMIYVTASHLNYRKPNFHQLHGVTDLEFEKGCQ